MNFFFQAQQKILPTVMIDDVPYRPGDIPFPGALLPYFSRETLIQLCMPVSYSKRIF